MLSFNIVKLSFVFSYWGEKEEKKIKQSDRFVFKDAHTFKTNKKEKLNGVGYL